ncbi:Maf family protein [Aquibacillus rhizosphaerae]|uniref:dTTP/UTP pyrophosphatase n=1 Tax=Aquibacillus rhizosphaerae TaxID=3051431 RepID=A0ABT7L8H4_9BACI|nr:Maf family protein [Aquibacillus sp. LR5S19]MDL4841669.1 Maf family protein [Aquibacillus sp. LR5S19]
MNQLILASGSPRRSELLKQVGIPFTVIEPNVDETLLTEQNPVRFVELLANQKGLAIEVSENRVILSADTVVSMDGNILTKPENWNEAYNMLNMLNGKKHEVYTGVMIRSSVKEIVFSRCTTVQFLEVTEKELKDYVNSGDSFDKAGGYGIQSRGAFLVKEIIGDYYNVVGLPVSKVVQRLREFDVYPELMD